MFSYCSHKAGLRFDGLALMCCSGSENLSRAPFPPPTKIVDRLERREREKKNDNNNNRIITVRGEIRAWGDIML